MPAGSHFVAFLVTAAVFVLIPGPSVLFTIGRAVSLGRREALLSVFGNGLGTFTLSMAIAFGLGPIVAASAVAFTALKVAGAAYLLYLGVQAWRHRSSVATALRDGTARRGSARHAIRTGWLVGVTNPKSLVFLAALLPQFVDRHATTPVWLQLVVLAAVITGLGWISDGAFALAAGQLRTWFARSPERMERVGGTGGLMMIGLGTALLFTGRPD